MAHGQISAELNGPVLRELRELGGMNLRDLAKQCELKGVPISHSQLSKYERGKCRPRPALLPVLASVFGCEPRDLCKSSASPVKAAVR
jgi:transcriptional regulator with XRE-family HTH domain